VVAAAINGVYALAETAIHRSIFERFQTLSEIDPLAAKQLLMAKMRGGSYRAQASFDHPILFAEFLAFMLPFAIASMFRGKIQWAYLVAIGLILLGLVLSKSRTAAVGALVGGIGAALLLLRQSVQAGRIGSWVYPAILIGSPIVIGAAFIAFNEIAAIAMGKTGAEASSTLSRFGMLVSGVKLALSSPLLGYGIGLGARELNFQNGSGVITLDNYYLLLTLDSGIPALLAFAACYFMIFTLQTKRIGAPANFRSAAIPALVFFALSKVILGTYLNNFLIPLIISITIAMASPSPGASGKKLTPSA
jgi:O-antigen ligase